jgi:hypothetical protein
MKHIKHVPKPDTSVNGKIIPERDTRLYPLKIDERTTIMVPKWKQTREYAEQYRKRHNIGIEHKGGASVTVDADELLRLRKQRWSYDKLAGHFGCSKNTIMNNLRRLQDG